MGVLRLLPLAVAMRLSAAGAALVIRVARPIRRIGITNLTIAFPEKTEAERAAILLASYRNLGRMIAECAHLRDLDATNVGDTIRFDDDHIWTQEIQPHLASQG